MPRPSSTVPAFFLCILACFFGVAFQSCSNNTSSGSGENPKPLAHWDFDDCATQTLRDKSGNRLDGAVHGAVCAEGAKGKSLSFNGTSDYVDVDMDSLLDLDSNMTLSAWIRPEDMEATNFWYEVVSKRITYNSAFGLNIKVGGGAEPYLQWYFGGASTFHIMVSKVVLADDVWAHIVLTRKIEGGYSKMKVFANGVLVDSAAIEALPEKHPSSPFTIGRNSDPLPNPSSFKGRIDEVSVYAAALDSAQVSKLYLSIKP